MNPNLNHDGLNMRDIAMIDAFPVYDVTIPIVLDVGCGAGHIGFYLCRNGYQFIGVDLREHEEWYIHGKWPASLSFHTGNIFDVSTMPVESAPIVICSETLEHLPDYKEALKNLIDLTEIRLIITVPFKKSFNSNLPPPDNHVNFWTDEGSGKFKSIYEFVDLCRPYTVAISKIRTKIRDVEMNQKSYVLTIDKRQGFNA